jgi:DNA helicase-2/ATP-dependent DNA helicase PcrA
MVSLLKKPDTLNDAQWQAVVDPAKHLLITAGPGTGKTHTLVHRIAYFSSKLQGQEHILAITFTNKASEEMRQRLASSFQKDLSLVTACTFHSFCLSCLREFISFTNLPQDFQIASALDIEETVKEIWNEASRKERHQRLQEISRTKNFILKEPSVHLSAYNQQLRKNNLLDFDDILWEALCLFRDNKEVLKAIQNRYRYIFVDEYQDINYAQHQILKLLAQGNVGLTAIGDPHQAIYGFRGSDVRFFHDFLKDFPSAVSLSLCENYRSSENLIEAAQQVIIQGQSFDVSPLIARMHAQGRLVIYQAATERAEAEYIVHEIEKLVGGTSMFSKDSKRVSPQAEAYASFGDIGILCRMNAQRTVLEESLRRSSMPFYLSADKPLCEEEDVVALLPDLLKMKNKSKVEILSYFSELKEKGNNNLERLMNLAEQSKSAADFLDRLFLEREHETFTHHVEKISLLTLHAAKGLEFPIVFIAGCEDGILPLGRRGEEPNIEEERRLFYVGMTRAKRALYLTWAGKRVLYGKTRLCKVSPFVLDIEERLKKYEESSPKARKKQNNHQLNFFKTF